MPSSLDPCSKQIAGHCKFEPSRKDPGITAQPVLFQLAVLGLGVLAPRMPIRGEVTNDFVGKVTARVYIKFLHRVFWRCKDHRKIYIVTDNAKKHHAKIVMQFLKKIGFKVETNSMAPFSPELSPMKQIWKCMRKGVIHNTFYELRDDLKSPLRQFFEKIKFRSEEIRLLCKFY